MESSEYIFLGPALGFKKKKHRIWSLVPVLPVFCCVILGKSHLFSGPQFPPL